MRESGRECMSLSFLLSIVFLGKKHTLRCLITRITTTISASSSTGIATARPTLLPSKSVDTDTGYIQIILQNRKKYIYKLQVICTHSHATCWQYSFNIFCFTWRSFVRLSPCLHLSTLFMYWQLSMISSNLPTLAQVPYVALHDFVPCFVWSSP